MIYYNKHISIRKNKILEFQVSRWSESKMFELTTWRRPKGEYDHYGMEVCLTLLRYEFRIDFYDTRHKEHLTKE